MDGIFMGTTASLSPALHVGSINSHNAAEINCRALVPADHIRPPAPACPLPLVIRVCVGVCVVLVKGEGQTEEHCLLGALKKHGRLLVSKGKPLDE